MTSYLYADTWSAGLVLAAGMVSFAAFLGLGLMALRLARLVLPSPFREVTAALLGILIASLAVQLIAMTPYATVPVLRGLWWVSTGTGLIALAIVRPRLWPASTAPVPKLALALAATAGAVNLIAAIVPSTKIDELYYHMLTPARIVFDHGLQPYRQPIEAAVLPQMTFQILAAPLHALELPDAPNIVSWALGLLLVWMGWRLLAERKDASTLSYCLVAAIPCGAYPVVFHVTGGAHAFCDLALAPAVLALFFADRIAATGGPRGFAATVSLLAWAAASSKISLLPIAVAILALAAFEASRQARATSQATFPWLAALIAPWIVFGAPLAVWSWAYTGAPLGPLLSGLFGSNFYATTAFAEYAELSRVNGRSPLFFFDFDNAAALSPLIWLAALGLLACRAAPTRVRLTGGVLLLIQTVIVLWLLPYHVRFLGGLPYALAIAGALWLPAQWADKRRLLAAAVALGSVPWLAGQAAYASQFVPLVVGLDTRDDFHRKRIAMFDDFRKLDALLPPNAVLLAPGMRIAAVHAPRPTIFTVADGAPGQIPFLLAPGADPAHAVPDGYRAGRVAYVNERARVNVYRRWWVPPDVNRLTVVELERL